MGLKPRGVHRANRYRRTLLYVALHTLALIWAVVETERGDFRNTWMIILGLVLLWTWASVMCLLALELQDLHTVKCRLRYIQARDEYLARIVCIAQGDVEEIFASGRAGILTLDESGARAPVA